MYTIKTKAGGAIILDKDLEEGLRKCRVLTKAVRNIKTYWKDTTWKGLGIGLLITAFPWGRTPEGFKFWEDISDKLKY